MLAQCLNQTEPAVRDFREFLRAYGDDDRFPSLASDARKRLRRLSDEPRHPRAAEPLRRRSPAKTPAPAPPVRAATGPAPEDLFSPVWPMGWPEFAGGEVELVPGWTAQLGWSPLNTLSGVFSVDLAILRALPGVGAAEYGFAGVSLGALWYFTIPLEGGFNPGGVGPEATLLLGGRVGRKGGEFRLGFAVAPSAWSGGASSSAGSGSGPLFAVNIGGAAGSEVFHVEWGARLGGWVDAATGVGTPLVLPYVGFGM